LRRQPATRIACRGGQITRPRTQTKAQNGYLGLHHSTCNGETPTGLTGRMTGEEFERGLRQPFSSRVAGFP
jgi:hypothetical protein